ncbi:MAG TPA: C2H2-type zinc finger protein [Candidatus Nitrosotenuis sp.]|nr:C2H2-type zinc finger protein [Candidatus Nitrosotenuis sp.]
MRFFKKAKCEQCAESFSSSEELMQHQQIIHGKDTPYECKVCRKDFSNMQDMRTHLQRYHSYKS